MYRIKKAIKDGFIVVDEKTNEELEYLTKLPFYPGDLLINIEEGLNVKMIDQYENLLAQQVIKMAKKDSEEYNHAASILIENSRNPKFLEGEKLIDFLCYRKAIKELSKD